MRFVAAPGAQARPGPRGRSARIEPVVGSGENRLTVEREREHLAPVEALAEPGPWAGDPRRNEDAAVVWWPPHGHHEPSARVVEEQLEDESLPEPGIRRGPRSTAVRAAEDAGTLRPKEDGAARLRHDGVHDEIFGGHAPPVPAAVLGDPETFGRPGKEEIGIVVALCEGARTPGG